MHGFKQQLDKFMGEMLTRTVKHKDVNSCFKSLNALLLEYVKLS